MAVQARERIVRVLVGEMMGGVEGEVLRDFQNECGHGFLTCARRAIYRMQRTMETAWRCKR